MNVKLNRSMEHWRNDTERVKLKVPEGTCSSITSVTKNLTWIDLGSNASLQFVRPATRPKVIHFLIRNLQPQTLWNFYNALCYARLVNNAVFSVQKNLFALERETLQLTSGCVYELGDKSLRFSSNTNSLQLFHQPTLMHNFLYPLTICLLHYYPRHVSSINMPIFRRKNCIHTASGIVSLCKRLHSTLVESRLQSILLILLMNKENCALKLVDEIIVTNLCLTKILTICLQVR